MVRWEDRRGKGQLPALSMPGATCTGWGEWASHEAVACLAPALLFTSGRESKRRCQGASCCSLAPGQPPLG